MDDTTSPATGVHEVCDAYVADYARLQLAAAVTRSDLAKAASERYELTIDQAARSRTADRPSPAARLIGCRTPGSATVWGYRARCSPAGQVARIRRLCNGSMAAVVLSASHTPPAHEHSARTHPSHSS
jgi:hypothetical protein